MLMTRKSLDFPSPDTNLLRLLASKGDPGGLNVSGGDFDKSSPIIVSGRNTFVHAYKCVFGFSRFSKVFH